MQLFLFVSFLRLSSMLSLILGLYHWICIMTKEAVLFSKSNGLATLSLNRPEVRNAFDDKTIALLSKHLDTVSKDNEIKILILRGAGEHFSAGGDIHWMQKMTKTSEKENEEDALRLAKMMHNLYHLNKPSIVVTQGAVRGGAIGLVACCDIALSHENSTFCFSEVKLGLGPAVVSPYAIAAMGARAAKRYMLTAETFSAMEAWRLGLIHEVVQAHMLEGRLQFFINLLKSNGPMALINTKKLIHNLTDEDRTPIEKLELTARFLAKVRHSHEAKEGLAAFLEKRKPAWQGD